VKLAVKHNVALIPFGGGTNVSQSLLCMPNEKRMIVSVDMARMNKIKWVDKVNMLACVEAGIIGIELDKELEKYNVVMGHEPVSEDDFIVSDY
jgi:alkyldihydroxyacetonephosphate synthase